MNTRAFQRRKSGNMLVFTTAVTMAIIVPLLLFTLWYVRTLGSHQEQTTAAQGAALAAADSLGRIVVEDSEFGYVGLSDYAPIGPNTQAYDGQNLPVRGINTIFATIRLDMILADQINDPTMKAIAQRDYTDAMKTKNYLIAQLQDAIAVSPTTDFRDINGLPVRPYADALAAYNKNIIRMTGTANQVDPTTFKLTLGCLSTPGSTNTPIPQPTTFANVATSSTINEPLIAGGPPVAMYKSYVDDVYDGLDFVFGGCDAQIRLVNPGLFTTTVASLPWAVPTIVKVDADQIFAGGHGNPSSSTVHLTACAQPASVYDPRPTPGALKIDFPDGAIPELTKPGDILKSPLTTTPTTTLKSPVTGDFPPAPLVPITGGMPIIGTTPPPNQLFGTGTYDWLKRAGVRPNVQSVLDFMAKPFDPTNPAQTAAYEWDANGNVIYKVLPPTAAGYQVMASNMQLYGLSNAPLTSSNGNSYDFTSSDTAIQPGRMIGGLHAGEPLIDPTLAVAPLNQILISSADFLADPRTTAYGASILLLAFLAAQKARRRRLLNFQQVGILSATITVLTACGGAPPPPPPDAVLSIHSANAPIARTTYTKWGMSVEFQFKKHTGASS